MDDSIPAAAPLAVVRGEPLTRLPDDLYIPPDALEVFLETFEGPLDLLLYLIRRQNLDILDIPVAEITRQYMGYIALMQELRFELAAEYLVMAAWLAEIKSRLLLPRPAVMGNDDDSDPRAELVRRLQEYERFRQAALDLDELPRLERDCFAAAPVAVTWQGCRTPPPVSLEELVAALHEVLLRAELYSHHQVQREPLSVRERMSRVLDVLDPVHFTAFAELFTVEEGRAGVVVTLLAILELVREAVIDLVQNEAFAPIYVRLRT